MRRAATIAPTMMPIKAPSLRPVCTAAAVLEAGGGAAAEVGVGEAEDELVEEGVSLAAADFTALAAAPAALIKALSGLTVVAAACAVTPETWYRVIAAEMRTCRCMMAAVSDEVEVWRLLREQ